MYGPYQRIVLPDGSTLLVGAINQKGWEGYLEQTFLQAQTLWGTPPTLTVDAVTGRIAVEAPVGLITSVQVAGFGGLADNLTGIDVPVEFLNKFILIQSAGLGVITCVNGAGFLTGAVNRTLDSVTDRLLMQCIGLNSLLTISFMSNA